MSTTPNEVAVIVGSLRSGSFTGQLARALIALAPPSMRMQIVGIGELPLYNPDSESAAPQAWVEFRSRIGRADAVLFATPEYNRSIPGALKNALDVGSRPYGQSAWAKKPAAVISASPGAMGAFGANHHLRQTLVFLDMPAMAQPEAYLARVDKMFDASGQFSDGAARDFCAGFVMAFDAWIKRQRTPLCA